MDSVGLALKASLPFVEVCDTFVVLITSKVEETVQGFHWPDYMDVRMREVLVYR